MTLVAKCSEPECSMPAYENGKCSAHQHQSINDATPEEWDEAARASQRQQEEVDVVVRNAERMADKYAAPVYIVDVDGVLCARTEKRYAADAIETIKPPE